MSPAVFSPDSKGAIVPPKIMFHNDVGASPVENAPPAIRFKRSLDNEAVLVFATGQVRHPFIREPGQQIPHLLIHYLKKKRAHQIFARTSWMKSDAAIHCCDRLQQPESRWCQLSNMEQIESDHFNAMCTLLLLSHTFIGGSNESVPGGKWPLHH